MPTYVILFKYRDDDANTYRKVQVYGPTTASAHFAFLEKYVDDKLDGSGYHMMAEKELFDNMCTFPKHMKIVEHNVYKEQD